MQNQVHSQPSWEQVNFNWTLTPQDSLLVDAALPERAAKSDGQTFFQALLPSWFADNRDELNSANVVRDARARDNLEVGLIVKNLLDSLPPHLANLECWFRELPDAPRNFQRSLMEQEACFDLAGDYGAILARKGMSPETIYSVFVGLSCLVEDLLHEYPDRKPLTARDFDRFLNQRPLSESSDISLGDLTHAVRGEVRASMSGLYFDTEFLPSATTAMWDWTRQVLREGRPLPSTRQSG